MLWHTYFFDCITTRILKFIVFALLNYAHTLPVPNFIFTLTKFLGGSKEIWRQIQLLWSRILLVLFISACGIYSESEDAVSWKRRNLLARGIKGWYTDSQTTLTGLTGVPLEGTVLTVGLLASAPCNWEWFKCIAVTTAYLLFDRQSQLFTVKIFVHCRIMETSRRFLRSYNSKIIIVLRRQGLISKINNMLIAGYVTHLIIYHPQA